MSDQVTQGPDVEVYPSETSKTWSVFFQRNGITTDITDYDFSAVVLTGEVEVDTVDVTVVDGPGGEASVTVYGDVLDQLERYSTCRLSESTVFGGPFFQQRIVRQR